LRQLDPQPDGQEIKFRSSHRAKEQQAREFTHLKSIEAERAKQRQATSTGGSNPQLVVNVPEADTGRVCDIAAAKLGMSGLSAERAAEVADAIDSLEHSGGWKRDRA
jgi:hypothetical protein